MFQTISKSFTELLKKWTQGALSASQIKSLLQDIRSTLIDADTAVEAADIFIQSIETELMTHDYTSGSNPQMQLQAKIHASLVKILGQPARAIQPSGKPNFILLSGLQGAGKTTTAVKIAKWMSQSNKKIAVTSLDFQRPAAQKQLEILAGTADIPYIHAEDLPIKSLYTTLLAEAKSQNIDTLILDTAGRLHIDSDLMTQLSVIQRTFKPDETIFVLDSQTGQDAAISAKAFSSTVELTSCILTKCDADSKGGAALSLRTLAGKPISFIGTGEKMNDLEVFNPDILANRMLDLGDVAALVEKIKSSMDEEDAAKQAKKIAKGHYDLTDFLSQIQQMKSMGGASGILSMLPGAQSMPDAMKNMVDDSQSKAHEALILSMTSKERRHPMLLSQVSRKNRVIRGSGRNKKEFQSLLKQYEKMQGMIKKMSSSKIKMAMKMMKKNPPS